MADDLPSADAALLVEELDRELLVYELATDRAFCLNEPAARVFRALREGVPERRLSEELTRRHGTEYSPELVQAALGALADAGLFAHAEVSPTRLSRRRLLGRLAGAALVPSVVSVLAPSAAQAASCYPTGYTVGYGKASLCCSGKLFPFSPTCA